MAASFWQRLNPTRKLFTEDEILKTLSEMDSYYCTKESVDGAFNKLKRFKAGFLSKKLKQSVEEARRKIHEKINIGAEWKWRARG